MVDTIPAPKPGNEYDFMPIMIWGIISDVLVVVPVLLYTFAGHGYSKHH